MVTNRALLAALLSILNDTRKRLMTPIQLNFFLAFLAYFKQCSLGELSLAVSPVMLADE